MLLNLLPSRHRVRARVPPPSSCVRMCVVSVAKRLSVVFLLLSFSMVSFTLAYETDGSDMSDFTSDSEDDGIIERNPYFDDSEQYDTDEEMKHSKAVTNNALSGSQKGKSASVRFLKVHRKEITATLILFAFRREIVVLLRSLLVKTGPDGEKKIRRLPLSPTSILKIVLFFDIMLKMRAPSSHDGPSSPSSTASILGGGFLNLFHENLPPVEQHFTFERLNDRYRKDRMAYQKALCFDQRPTSLTSILAGVKKKRRPPHCVPDTRAPTNVPVSHRSSSSVVVEQNKNNAGHAATLVSNDGGMDNSTVILLDWSPLDTSVSQIDIIRDEVSFILHTHRITREDAKSKANTTASDKDTTLPELEVVVLLESPGGSASDYGLGACQMKRLRDEPGITLTVCVDKVAASGGYMMACVSHRLCCAQFAVVGSIGVIGQAINIHNTLQNWGVRPLVFRGGKDKAPVGMIGEVTKEGIAKVQSMVDKTHEAFKRHVAKARPGMTESIDDVATGDVYLGCDALEIGLVDRLVTSDEYVDEKIMEGAKVLKLTRNTRRSLHIFGPTPRRQGPFAQTASDLQRVLSRVGDILEGATSCGPYLDASSVYAQQLGKRSKC